MTVTTVIRQKSGRYAIACTRPDCDHYESGILTEPAPDAWHPTMKLTTGGTDDRHARPDRRPTRRP